LAQAQDIKDTVLHVGVGYTGGDSQVTPVNSGDTTAQASTTTRATIVAFRTEGRGLNNAYRAQIGGDTLITANGSTAASAYLQSANNAVTINQKLRGIELADARGPFKFQMETFNSKYNATGTAQTLSATATSAATSMGVQVKTQYMELMYNITGESWADAYKGGAFGGIKPKSVFMKDYGGVVGNGTGAWQVGFRTSKYTSDLDNTATCLGTAASPTCATTISGTGVTSSRVQNAETATTNTYAVNWILNSNARVMFNYAETKFGQSVMILDGAFTQSTSALSSGVTDKERVFSVRTQINF
jgi:phosphate-selective porin OprO/OprP